VRARSYVSSELIRGNSRTSGGNVSTGSHESFHNHTLVPFKTSGWISLIHERSNEEVSVSVRS
jgi:hypothetical protein